MDGFKLLAKQKAREKEEFKRLNTVSMFCKKVKCDG